MDPRDVEPALLAKRAFDDAFEKFFVAGVALKQAPTSDLVAVLSSAHEGLREAEDQAVSLHRRAFGGPTRAGVLHEACLNAGVQTPRSPLSDYNDEWEETIVLSIPLDVRSEARHLAAAARRLAESDRLFSAVAVLERLKTLA